MKKTGLADSPFFSPTPPKRDEQANDRTGERISERSQNRTDFRTEKRTDDLPAKRRTKRYSFEFYDDQLIKLKHLKYQAEIEGKSISLSEIVRQALDSYLKDR
jgi:hypothetical protein